MSFSGFGFPDDIFTRSTFDRFVRKSSGRVSPPRRHPKPGTGAGEGQERPWDADLPGDVAADSLAESGLSTPSDPAAAAVTLFPGWEQQTAFFNGKAVALVEADLPASLANLTRVEMVLYALGPDGQRERISCQDATLSGGKASCTFTLFLPSFRVNGELPGSCEYVFTARHSRSKEAESPRLKAEARAMGWLRLKLELAFQGPLAGRKCTLKVAGESHELTTDGNGVLAKYIPADAAQAEVLVHPDEEHPKAVSLTLAIDKLEPADRPAGARDRLDSMGYGPGADPERPVFRKALEEFQCDSRLAATGELDGATQGKLKEVFGC